MFGPVYQDTVGNSKVETLYEPTVPGEAWEVFG